MPQGWKKGLLAAGWNVHAAVELAIEVEEMGKATYDALASKWDSTPVLRDLFTRLAFEEVAHEEGLRTLLARLDPRRAESGLDVESLRSIAHASFFSSEGGPLGGLEKLSSAREILEAVLKFENGTTLYYRGLRDVLGASETLDLLVAEEVLHSAEITRALAALREPAREAGRGAAENPAAS
jgi:rubrerythrin